MLERNAKMEATIIYNDLQDRKLMEIIPNQFPIFVKYIDSNTTSGKKEARKIKHIWSARKEPFVILETDEHEVMKVFYTESGDSAINQLIKFINESKNQNQET